MRFPAIPFTEFISAKFVWPNQGLYIAIKNTMTRQEKIQWLLDNVFQNPIPNIKDWRSFLDHMTDDELVTLMRVQKLENEGVLTPGDILPMVEILEKYSGGKGVILEHHDPEDYTSDNGTKWN